MSHRLNCVQSPFTAKGLCPFRNPMNIVLEQLRAKNGSPFTCFRVKKVVFFAREKHVKLKSTNEIQH